MEIGNSFLSRGYRLQSSLHVDVMTCCDGMRIVGGFCDGKDAAEDTCRAEETVESPKATRRQGGTLPKTTRQSVDSNPFC
jgi:hypothetical protein